jgi:hypothetical protein
VRCWTSWKDVVPDDGQKAMSTWNSWNNLVIPLSPAGGFKVDAGADDARQVPGGGWQAMPQLLKTCFFQRLTCECFKT